MPLPSSAALHNALDSTVGTLRAVASWADAASAEGHLFDDVARASLDAAVQMDAVCAPLRRGEADVIDIALSGLAKALTLGLMSVSTLAHVVSLQDRKHHLTQQLHGLAHSSLDSLNAVRAAISSNASLALSAASAALAMVEGVLVDGERAFCADARSALSAATARLRLCAHSLSDAPLSELPLAAAYEAIALARSALAGAVSVTPALASHAFSAATARAGAMLGAALRALDLMRAVASPPTALGASLLHGMLRGVVGTTARYAAAIDEHLGMAPRLAKAPLRHWRIVTYTLSSLQKADEAVLGGQASRLTEHAMASFTAVTEARPTRPDF